MSHFEIKSLHAKENHLFKPNLSEQDHPSTVCQFISWFYFIGTFVSGSPVRNIEQKKITNDIFFMKGVFIYE